MKEFLISTDSAVDLPEKYLNENNILIHDLYYTIDNEEHKSGISEDKAKEFYEYMKNGSMPTTSALNPIHTTELMKREIEKGYDILHISFSSQLSSSYNNAVLCARSIMDEIEDSNIWVVDSFCASIGQGIIVKKAIELKKEGKTMEEIASWIESNKKHVIHTFTVKDLSYLVHGGRISKSAGAIGGMLDIQPVLKMDSEGKLVPTKKVRGRKKALNNLIDIIEEKTKGIKLDTVFISHADCIDDAKYLEKKIKERYNVEEIIINYMCPSIGAHTGIGGLLVSYLGNER